MSKSVREQELLQRRRKMALDIADAIDRKWPNLGMEGYDVDEAAEIIDLFIPLTHAEADASLDEIRGDDDAPPRGPGIMAKLREAMGLESGSLGDVVGRAAIRLTALQQENARLRGVIEEATGYLGHCNYNAAGWCMRHNDGSPCHVEQLRAALSHQLVQGGGE